MPQRQAGHMHADARSTAEVLGVLMHSNVNRAAAQCLKKQQLAQLLSRHKNFMA
jgi:hypothetical protein